MFSSLISLLMPGKSKAATAVLAPDILVDVRDVGPGTDSYAPVQACIDFCNWCRQDAGLGLEEVAPDAWRCYFVDYYRAQVSNGGHAQFAGNSGLRPRVLDFIAEGLKAMEASEFLEIFEEFRHAMDRDPALRRRTVESGGFGDIPDVIEALDRRFFALNSIWLLVEHTSAWVTTRPTWTPLPPSELAARKTAILAGSRSGRRR
ncbi:MAG: DMP19 family protein [Alphaproteobacteria bacterium]|nr:DMP19 family protein [Alphaproteobacteria bacterium]MBU2270738.1 DMP19 family protein [Alphaproteobacteria bacterium]